MPLPGVGSHSFPVGCGLAFQVYLCHVLVPASIYGPNYFKASVCCFHVKVKKENLSPLLGNAYPPQLTHAMSPGQRVGGPQAAWPRKPPGVSLRLTVPGHGGTACLLFAFPLFLVTAGDLPVALCNNRMPSPDWAAPSAQNHGSRSLHTLGRQG